jgi:hypothetical protein
MLRISLQRSAQHDSGINEETSGVRQLAARQAAKRLEILG